MHVCVGIRLDGYVAAPDGGADWLEPYGDAVARGYGKSGELPPSIVGYRLADDQADDGANSRAAVQTDRGTLAPPDGSGNGRSTGCTDHRSEQYGVPTHPTVRRLGRWLLLQRRPPEVDC
jgi:hypothetical protein